jgi:phage terminase small subunit
VAIIGKEKVALARPRKPTYIKQLAGTLRKHRMNQNEPKVAAGRPEAPSWLTERAARIFEATCDAMEQRGTLASEWVDVIAAFATARDEEITAAEAIAVHGETFIAGDILRRRPEVAQRNVAQRLANRLRSELGLGPVSAGRL